eukprot:16434924-Heterocapsa_arctica.AAC.2
MLALRWLSQCRFQRVIDGVRNRSKHLRKEAGEQYTETTSPARGILPRRSRTAPEGNCWYTQSSSVPSRVTLFVFLFEPRSNEGRSSSPSRPVRAAPALKGQQAQAKGEGNIFERCLEVFRSFA